jgi:hypothetical protein
VVRNVNPPGKAARGGPHGTPATPFYGLATDKQVCANMKKWSRDSGTIVTRSNKLLVTLIMGYSATFPRVLPQSNKSSLLHSFEFEP